MKRIILAVLLLCLARTTLAVEYVTYYFNDAQGTPIAATNEAGTVIWKKEHTPYGEDYGNVDDKANRVGFTGHVEEEQFNLVYMQQRWYDPAIGRFYSIDPVGFDEANPMSFNRYMYANDNPYRFVDPDGRDVVFSVDPKAAGGNGHTTLYFQDKKSNWYSYDQGAAGQSSSGGDLGALMGQDMKAGVSIQKVDPKNVPSDGLRYNTTSEQDNKIAKSALNSQKDHNSGNKEYNLYSNNCTDAAVDVVNDSGAGIKVKNSSATVKPNSWIKEQKNEGK